MLSRRPTEERFMPRKALDNERRYARLSGQDGEAAAASLRLPSWLHTAEGSLSRAPWNNRSGSFEQKHWISGANLSLFLRHFQIRLTYQGRKKEADLPVCLNIRLILLWELFDNS